MDAVGVNLRGYDGSGRYDPKGDRSTAVEDERD
jgi:hypothetical protein